MIPIPILKYWCIIRRSPVFYRIHSSCLPLFNLGNGIRVLWMMLLLSSAAYAKDFGYQGNVFQILERDLQEVIEERLQSIDQHQLQERMKERVYGYLERPPAVLGIKEASEEKTFLIDPTYVAESDVKDHHGSVIFFKGSTINPLDHIMLREKLFFFDGNKEEQIALAKQLKEKENGKIKLILVSGATLALQKRFQHWMYFDQKGFITKKLSIKEVPALVEQEGKFLKVTIMKVGS